MRQIEHGADRLHRLLRRHAQALEPDVDLDEEVARAARRLRVGPGRVEIDEGGNQIVGQRLGRGARQRVRIHEDRRRDPVLPEPDALAQIGHRQPVGSVPRERRPHLGGTEAIAARFDDGENLALRADELAHRAHVVRRGVEIDLEQRRARRAAAHRDSCRQPRRGEVTRSRLSDRRAAVGRLRSSRRGPR